MSWFGSMGIDSQSILKRDQEPVAASVDDEIVMLSARAEAYFGLDRIGSKIWVMLEQPRRVSEICAALAPDYDVAPATCEQDVLKFLNDLLRHGLVKLVTQESAP